MRSAERHWQFAAAADDEATHSADEGSCSTDEGTWGEAQDSQHIQVEAAPPGPVASSKGSPLKTGLGFVCVCRLCRQTYCNNTTG